MIDLDRFPDEFPDQRDSSVSHKRWRKTQLMTAEERTTLDDQLVEEAQRGVEVFNERFPLGTTIDEDRVTMRIVRVNRVGGGKVQAHSTDLLVGSEISFIAEEINPERQIELAAQIGFILGKQLASGVGEG